MRTLAIGDIHGCFNALTTMADAIQFRPDDLIVLLGDYIDRGPDSKRVVDWILEQRSVLNFIALRGNHEAMILL